MAARSPDDALAPVPPGGAPSGSPPAQAAAAAVLALARAARTFCLYDARNEVTRQFLEGYRERMREALDRFGELPLDVGPFEVSLRGEVVYRDPDRERSLAFRLFREGVRRVVLSPRAGWEELLQLLEIVALRYTAVRQQEEDAVTLLRKADLPGIRVVAVEGFTPAEDRPEPEVAAGHRSGPVLGPPPAWDVPLPLLPPPAPPAFRPVPEEALAPLRAEASDDSLPRTALGLARDLLAEAVRAAWPRPNRDLVAFFAELRDAFLADRDLGGLRALVELIVGSGAGDARDELLSGLGDARALDLVLEALPEGGGELPPDLLPLVPLLGLGAALDRLPAEPDPGRRELLVQLVLARLPREAEAVLGRLPSLEPGLARQLARGLAARAPERAAEVARVLLGQRDDDLRLEGLDSLARADGEVPVDQVAPLLSDRSEAVRLKACEVLARRGDEGAVAHLVRALEAGEPGSRETEALGRALAEVAPIPASRTFAGWLRPRGRILAGPSDRERRLQRAAVAGLGALPGAEAERQLQALAEESADDLRRHCLAELARRRRGVGRG